MTPRPIPLILRILPVLGAALLASGCAAFRAPIRHPMPPPPSTVTTPTPPAAFHAVYEGDLRIGFSFHRFQAIWYVAMTPGASNLSAAVLNPIGIKIMQMQGNSSTQECRISVPNAERLKPYGEALFGGLLWAFADPAPSPIPPSGTTTQYGPVTIRYTAQGTNDASFRKTISNAGRLAYTLDFEPVPGATQSALRIRCESPRCTLTLKPGAPARTSVTPKAP